MPTKQLPQKFDLRTIIAAGLLSGGLGIGGGLFGPSNGISQAQLEIIQTEILREVSTLEARSEKRYKRGMAFGEKMEQRAINEHKQLNDLRVKVAKLEARAELCNCQ